MLGLAAAVLAAAVVFAIIGLDRLPAAAEQETSPATATAPVVEPAPAELPGWARRLAKDYEEACGTQFDPALIAGMNRREAEAAIEPRIESCEEEEEDDDD